MRVLDPVFEKFIDSRVAYDLSEPPVRVLPRVFKAMVGIKESGGDNRGDLVEAIQRTIGRAEREAWCVAAMQAGIAWVESKFGVVCPLPATESSVQLYYLSSPEIKTDVRAGSIRVWQDYDKKPDRGWKPAMRGHVAYVYSTNGEFDFTYEGNTSESPGVVREGDGFYVRSRKLIDTRNRRTLGYLKVEFHKKMLAK